MKKTLFMIATGIAMSVSLQAQTTPLPYNYGFENMTGWQVFRKAATPTYNWLIKTTGSYAGTGNLYHDYPVGSTTVTDDWYVSPAFSFAAGGKIDSLRTRFAGFGTPQVDDTVAIYLLKGNPDPATATAKVLLYDFRDTRYVNDYTWNKITNIAIPSSSGNCYIAIRYRTIVNWLDVSFDNLRVSGGATSVPVTYKAGVHFSVGPNPATNQLNIATNETFQQLSIYDMTSKKVHTQPFQPVINIAALPAGTYVLEMVDKQQQKGTSLIVKQ